MTGALSGKTCKSLKKMYWMDNCWSFNCYSEVYMSSRQVTGVAFVLLMHGIKRYIATLSINPITR